jgi:hypothetical protein
VNNANINLNQQKMVKNVNSGAGIYSNNMKMGNLKEIDDINMHVYNLKEDNINDIDFDDRMGEDGFNTRKNNI